MGVVIVGHLIQLVYTTPTLLLECLDNKEMAIQDASNRLKSLMYYEWDSNNIITKGRDMG
jgi:hypothetical protein